MLPIMIMIVEWLVLGALGPVVLILLLATRIVGFDVRSRGSNRLSVRFSPGDAGVSEERFDAFFQRSMPKWSTPEHYSHNRMFPQYE